jgi:hypothetical protein
MNIVIFLYWLASCRNRYQKEENPTKSRNNTNKSIFLQQVGILLPTIKKWLQVASRSTSTRAPSGTSTGNCRYWYYVVLVSYSELRSTPVHMSLYAALGTPYVVLLVPVVLLLVVTCSPYL